MYETFQVVGEGCLPYGNKELLYIEGVTLAGSVRCGVIECRIIHVPGFLISRHSGIDERSGNPISEVEPISNSSVCEEMKRLLSRIFPSYLLLFS